MIHEEDKIRNNEQQKEQQPQQRESSSIFALPKIIITLIITSSQKLFLQVPLSFVYDIDLARQVIGILAVCKVLFVIVILLFLYW